ncbi:hypothetical protein MMC08_004893 [Hypocenomyce scalaris]|nr:hypothetical protein [Hypocenomyce scalaris]
MHKWLPDVCRAILTSLSKLVILKQALISGITGLDGDTTYIGSDSAKYHSVHNTLFHDLYTSSTEKEKNKLKATPKAMPCMKVDISFNLLAHRRLMHAAFDGNLETLMGKRGNTCTSPKFTLTRKEVQEHDDHGASFLYERTRAHE